MSQNLLTAEKHYLAGNVNLKHPREDPILSRGGPQKVQREKQTVHVGPTMVFWCCPPEDTSPLGGNQTVYPEVCGP